MAMSIKKSIKRKSSKKSSKVPKTKEAFKSHLSFHFKNLRNPEIEYEAHYVSQGITGKWFDIQTDSGNTHFYEDEAWAIFRKNAEFDDIFKGLRPYDIHDIARFSKPNFRDYQKWSDREFLRELSLHPDWLAYPETGATTRLISVVKTARITNTDEAREARENLQECFIPKRPHRNRTIPENL